MPKVTMRLEGAEGAMDARALRAGLEHFTRFLSALADETACPLPIVDLKVGSLFATVDTPQYLQDRVDEGLTFLRSEGARPITWPLEALKQLSDYANLKGRYGVEQVGIDGHDSGTIDEQLKAAIEKALSGLPLSLGAIQGRISSYFGVSRPVKVRVVPDGMRSYVRIAVPDAHLAEQAARLVEQRVIIRGLMVRHPESGAIEEMTAHSIEKIEEPEISMSVDEAVGIWPPNLFEGMTSVQIARMLRNEA